MLSSNETRRSVMKWKRWLLIGVLAAIVAVVGGPFAFIHLIEGKAPAPLALSASQPSQTSTGSSLDGAWKVASGSVAGYRVNEVLFGQNATAVGRTSEITGSLVVAGTTVKNGTVTVDMTSVTSDKTMRDNQFNGRIMQTSTYPTATFTFDGPVDVGVVPAEGSSNSYTVSGKLTLHGTTRSVTVTLTGRRTATQIQVTGEVPVRFADYNIANPSFGPVSTEDHGVLEFSLGLTHG
jgi:polyisoprenoid-binding protein YceI